MRVKGGEDKAKLLEVKKTAEMVGCRQLHSLEKLGSVDEMRKRMTYFTKPLLMLSPSPH